MVDKPKSPNGANPPHQPTKETSNYVRQMSGVGVTQEDISKAIGIDRKTLTKYYRKELDEALVHANTAVGRALYSKATEEKDTSAIIWWEKTRAGKSDKLAIDNRFPDGHPMEALNFGVIKPKTDE